jgi:Zn finger protein HypA/HybF involved in hydrogenase expression
MPLEEALTNPSPYLNMAKLKRRLLKAGLKSLRCEMCNITSWRDKVLPFQLDHIDGNRTNNLLENLRMLCPNCHAQTETWCRKRSSRPT